MALVKFGGGIQEMRGSIGGTVFSRNKGGNYARGKTTPINPNTALQQIVRNTLSNLTTRWAQTLTAAQRTAWNLYADSVTVLNRLSESVNISGFNHYIRSNSLLLRSARPIVDDGPTVFEIPEGDPTFAITISEATQFITMTFDDTATWHNETGGYLWPFGGQPQNPQRNFFDGPWRFMSRIEGNDAGGPGSPADRFSQFAVSEGQHVWTYGRIQRKDGRLSEVFRADNFSGA